jgi:hypothetical protein
VPNRLVRVPFGRDPTSAAAERQEVADFDCGAEPWELEVSDWLRGVNPDDSVWVDLQRPGTRVWLYYTQAGELAGVGALGEPEWTLKKKEPRSAVTLLTNLAVAKRFRHFPKGPDEVTYGKQIMRDLRAEAEKSKATRPVLALCVHPQNPAREWYLKEGFAILEPPTLKSGHFRMGLDLNKVASVDPADAVDNSSSQI